MSLSFFICLMRDPSNYRPDSLLPPLGKVLDAIQSEHLLSYLEKNDLLSKHQFGFLPHRSTVLQLIYVADTWMTALDRGKQPSAVFMDFKKAFDRVLAHWPPAQACNDRSCTS